MAAPSHPTEHLLSEAWPALSGNALAAGALEVADAGEDLLPSTLPVLPAMLAAIGSSTLAAAALDGSRAGRAPATAHVEAEHAALAAHGERHARVVGAEPQPAFAPLSRFFQTSDGWIRLHANYPWHRGSALAVIGGTGAPDAVAERVRGWTSGELEEALAGAGALGFAVSPASRWAVHPQGRALAGQPLVHHDPAPAGAGALRYGAGRGAQGIRVLDLTRVIAGPVATKTLAAWGADVLRIDSPRLPEIPAQAVDMLPGKRSAELDFATPGGRAALDGLLEDADVVVLGYRPGALDRFGLEPAELAARHPHLVVVALSAWGHVGPWAGRRGFDSLVQCPTGIAAQEGSAGVPGALPVQALDHATGYLAAAAAMLGLAGRVTGRPSGPARLSLARTARWLQSVAPDERAPSVRGPAAVERHRVALGDGHHVVHVVAPPGRAGDLAPAWTASTTLGADPAAFRPR